MSEVKDFGFLGGANVLYKTIQKTAMVAMGGWATIGIIFFVFYLYGDLMKIRFSPTYKNFISELTVLGESKDPFAVLDFCKKFQMNRDTIGLLGSLTPARPITLAILPNSSFDHSLIFISLSMVFVSIPFLQIYVPRMYGLPPYVLQEGKKSWAFSIIIVALFSCLQAYLDWTPIFAPGGITPAYFWLITFCGAYTGCFIFLVLRYVVDGYFMSKDINPQEIWRDDLIIFCIAAPLLFVAGNGLLDILLEALAGMSPFLISKWMNWKWEAPKTPVPEIDQMMSEGSYIEFCDMMLGISIFAFIFVFGFVTPPSFSSDKDLFRSEKLALYDQFEKQLRSQYKEGKKKDVPPRILEFIALSHQHKDKEIAAFIYAWNGEKKKALKLIEGLPKESLVRVELLLQGKSPVIVEGIFNKHAQDLKNLGKMNKSYWNQYEIGKDKNFDAYWLNLLANSRDRNHIDTAASIYAWLGKTEQAVPLAASGVNQTPQRVEMLLKGSPPPEVEKILKQQKNKKKGKKDFVEFYKEQELRKQTLHRLKKMLKEKTEPIKKEKPEPPQKEKREER